MDLVTDGGRRLGRGLVLSSAAITVTALLCAAAGLAGWSTGYTPWLLCLAAMGVAGVASWRAAGGSCADPVVRRFWRRLAGVTFLTMTGLVVETTKSIGTPAAGVPPERLVAMVFYLLALGTILWALLTLPTGRRERSSWFTFALDAGTVVVAGGLFTWHFALRSAIDGGTGLERCSLLVLGVFAVVGVLAVLRVSLAWSGPVDRQALRLLGCSVLTGVGVSAVAPLVLDAPQHVTNGRLSAPIACLVWVFAAVRQRRAVARSHRPHRAARRPFSLLPYVAVAAVDGLLVLDTPDSSTEGRIVVYGAVLLTALVVARQLLAFHDNFQLLRRIDAGMLELRHHEQRFRSLVQHAADIILITDAEGKLRYTSPALRRVLGLAEQDLAGQHIGPYLHPADRALVRRQIAQVAAEPVGMATFRARVAHADGSWRWLEIISTNLLADPSVRGIVSNARDITETLRYQEQLAHQATHDELTRLPNRTLLLEQARAALGSLDAEVSIALIDLDDFKVINDRLGHEVGDALLVAVSRVLAGQVGPAGMVARLGGDEFAVLLRATPQDATANVERITAALDMPLHAAGYDLLVQASTGLTHGAAGDDAAELLRRADVALYAAKDHGKGRYASYEPALDVRSAENAQTGAELRQAIDAGDQLHLVYQPIVTLPHGTVSGVEALVRWRHPQRGPVSPGDFIPIAERTGLIVPMGRWILREACRQAVEWAADPETTPITVSVNVSARQLREPGFPDEVAAVLRETGLDPRRLTVEVTETAVFDSDTAVEALRGIHALGVRVALDDFGTGHSSLGLLRSCPVDELKVDKSFIDGVTGGAEQAAIAISLLQITSTLRLAAVAEGVESEAQARTLHELGYQLAQGFHFARPAPPEEIRDLLVAAEPAVPR